MAEEAREISPTLDRVRTESGETLDAAFHVAPEGGELAVYLESRSGALRSPQRRNPDYNQALWYILTRLAAIEAVLLDATVASSETRHLALDDRRLAIGQAYPVALAANDPADLRLRLTRAQRTIGRPADSGPGGNNTKRIRLLIRPRELARADAVRDILASGSSDSVTDAVEAINALSGRRRGQGFASDSASKRVVEDRAMNTVRTVLEAEGWNVEDVSRDRSYDFDCERDGDNLRVEVKGTRGSSDEILVTANEVRHAREHGGVALAIVSGIKVLRDGQGKPVADGGTLMWIRPWSIDQGTLVPLAYSWRIPSEAK